MIKRLLLLLIIVSGYAQAQFVTVKATVSDRNNHLYANCSWHVTFLGDPSSTIHGAAFDQSFTGTCNADAYMSLTLPQNSQIHPFGSQWTVAFCNSTGVFCASTPLTIGHSDPQDISVSLRSVAPILPSILPYLDLVANLSNPTNPDYGAARIFYNQNTARVEAIDPNGVNVLFGGSGGGGVSSIATTAPIVGGPITSTGTISCPACALGPGTSGAGHVAFFSGTNGLTLANGSLVDDGAGAVTLTGSFTVLPDTGITGTEVDSDKFCISASCWYRGSGNPEGVITAQVGSFYSDTNALGSFYYKSNGVSDTGWLPLGTGSNLCTLNGAAIAGSSCYPTIQSAITAIGSGGVVIVPAGSYAPTSTTTISGLNHLTIQFNKGATVTAQSGLGANPVFLITGSSNNINIIGAGKIDGASIASQCVGINNASTFVTVDGLECTGTTSNGIDARMTSGSLTYDTTNVTVKNTYVHDISGSGIAFRGKDMAALNNTVVTVGQSSISCAGERQLIQGNTTNDWNETGGNTGSGVHCFAASESDISDNKATGKSPSTGNYGIYCDTCFTTTVSRNMIDHTGSGMRVEVPYNVTAQNNVITDVTATSGTGILFNSRIDPSVINALDSTTGLTAGTNVTLTVDSVVKVEGTGSVQAVLAAGFAGGLVMSQVLGSTQDWTTRPISRIYFRTDTLLNKGVLNLILYSDAGCSTAVSTIPFPHSAISQWLQEELYDLEWFPKYSSPGIRCWAVTATSAAASTTLHFDDYVIDVPGGSGVVADNNITRTGDIGIQIETTVGPVTVHHNHIDNAGWYNPTGNGVSILLQTGGLNATANQVISNTWVDSNILRNSMNLSDSAAFGIRSRMTNGGTGNNNYLWMNDISQNFNGTNQVSSDATAGVVNMVNLTSDSAAPAFVFPGTIQVNSYQVWQTTTAAVQTRWTTADDGSTGNITTIDVTPTNGQGSAVRWNRNVNVGAGTSKFQWFQSDGTSTITAFVDMKTGEVHGGSFTGSTASLGTDNSDAGSVTIANGSSNAHTIFTSGATTTNTIKGFATVPTTGHIVTCTVSGTTCTLTDGGAPGGAGTVTSIATTSPITGGTITTTGTIACATCGVTGSPLSQFAATTSSQLAGVISDETGSGVLVFGTAPTFTTSITTPTLLTTTKCAAAGTAANPSVAACSAAPSGSFSCATNASTGTCTVTTSAVTASSAIFVQPDSSLGSLLSVTCNTTADSGLTAPRVSARSAATSFTITLGTFATNPLCYNYWIVN